MSAQSSSPKFQRHLDLGFGQNPRNPYNAAEVFGIDIGPNASSFGENFKCANLSIDPIPFPDSFFDSVSGFDFLEHIPRQAIDFDKKLIKLPFIELMNEIHRVLKPNGLFYAVTPSYPSEEAFQDPTHVNIITDRTHQYFCNSNGNYGFKGNFEAVEISWTNISYAQKIDNSFSIKLKRLHKKFFKGGNSHLLWQLKAIK
jgi:SAM-dependent methyltransferase